MKCPMCGENVKPEEGRCPSCGMAVQQEGPTVREAPESQPFGPPPIPPFGGSQAGPRYGGPECGSKQEFYKRFASKQTKSTLTVAGAILYICAAMNLVVGYIPDAAIILVLGLVIHLRGNRPCAVIMLVYSIFSCIVTSLARGTPSGWLLIIAGISAVQGAFALEKEYRAFRGQ